MKKILHVKVLLMAIMIALMVNFASAVPVSSIPGGTVIPIPGVDYAGGAGPHSFGPGITWTADQNYGFFGHTHNWGYPGNGVWNGDLGPMAGLNTVVGTMTFAFNTPVKGVGGFINHMPSYSTMPTTIAVYDSDMNLIESETLTFITDGSTNSGEFHGFLEPSPTISYFTLSNNYIGITQFTIPAQASASMTLTKSASVYTLPATGGPVTYTYVLENTGDVDITNYVLSDDKLGMIDQQPDNVLEAGTTTKYETTKTIGATTTNTATVSYVDPAGVPISVTSNAVTVTVSGTEPVPEFPTMALPAMFIVSILGAVLYIQRTREK